jgi:hypothetical protein
MTPVEQLISKHESTKYRNHQNEFLWVALVFPFSPFRVFVIHVLIDFFLAKVGTVSQWRRVDGELRGFARKGAVQAKHLGG